MRFHPIAMLFATLPAALVAPAYADDVFPRDLIEVVHPGTMVGTDEVAVRVLALNIDGTPTTGLKLSPEASSGTAKGWQEAGEGWYSFRYTPDPVKKPTTVTLGVKGKSTVKVLVLPNKEGKIAVQAKPQALILGRTPSATVTLKASGVKADELRLQASAGTVSDLTDMGGGTFTARYEPPSVNYPHLAVITAVSTVSREVYGHGVVVLQGAVEFPVAGTAGDSVVLQIDGTDYGPVKLDASGKAKVPIVVSPGVNAAKRVDVSGGNRTESDFDLQLPATRRLAWIPSGGIPQSGGTVRFVVRTPTGDADPSANPTVSSPGGDFGGVKNLGNGTYETTFTPKGAGVVAVTAKLGPAKVDAATVEYKVMPSFPTQVGNWPAPSTAAAANVVVVPLARSIAAGNDVEVVVAAVDALGYPVPNTTLTLAAVGGSVPSEVKTDSSGVATIAFKGTPGLARVSATVGELSSANSILVADGGPSLSWPASNGVQGRWERLVPRSKAPIAAAAPKPEPTSTSGVPDPRATIATIEVVVPDGIQPGSKATITAKAFSEKGAPVPGKSLDFLANNGAFSDITDVGDGTYTATYKAPKQKGEVKFTVLDDAGVLGRAVVPLDNSAAVTQVKPKTPSSNEHVIPKVRIRAGFAGGAYQYAQRPSSSPGPLLPGALIVGGQDGGAPAPLLGVDAQARAWFIPYFGADLAFRGQAYGIRADIFSEDARDWLVHGRAHLAGRYPFAIKNDQFWVGVQAGFQIDDFLVFKGCLDPGCQVAYEPLMLPGLEIGGSIGAEFGPIFFVGSFNQGLANGSVPYRINVDLDLGIEVHRNVFIDLGFVVVTRQLLVRGASSDTEFGQLSDTALSGRGSLGVQF